MISVYFDKLLNGWVVECSSLGFSQLFVTEIEAKKFEANLQKFFQGHYTATSPFYTAAIPMRQQRYHFNQASATMQASWARSSTKVEEVCEAIRILFEDALNIPPNQAEIEISSYRNPASTSHTITVKIPLKFTLTDTQLHGVHITKLADDIVSKLLELCADKPEDTTDTDTGDVIHITDKL